MQARLASKTVGRIVESTQYQPPSISARFVEWDIFETNRVVRKSAKTKTSDNHIVMRYITAWRVVGKRLLRLYHEVSIIRSTLESKKNFCSYEICLTYIEALQHFLQIQSLVQTNTGIETVRNLNVEKPGELCNINHSKMNHQASTNRSDCILPGGYNDEIIKIDQQKHLWPISDMTPAYKRITRACSYLQETSKYRRLPRLGVF